VAESSSLPLARIGNAAQPMRAGDTLTFNCDVVFAGGTTGVSVSHVTDGTGDVGFTSTAGIWASSGVTDLTMTGSGATVFGSTGTGTLSLRSATGTSQWGDGTAYFQMGGSGAFTSSGITTFGLSGSGAMTIGTTSTGTLAVRSNTATASFGDATGAAVFSGSGGLSTSGVTSVDLDGSGAIQINSSAGKLQIGNDAVAQDLDLGTGGARNIHLGNSAAAIFVQTGEIFSEGTNAAPIVQAIMKTAGATLAVGDVLAYATTSGKMVLADANGAANLRNAVGSCQKAAAADGSPTGLAMALEVPVKFAVAPAASDIGSIVYLSETAGRGVLDVSGFTAGSAIFKLGTLAFADGADTVCRVLWAPMFVMNA